MWPLSQVAAMLTCAHALSSPSEGSMVAGRFQSMVLSQDCLGRPILRLQSPGGPKMQGRRAR